MANFKQIANEVLEKNRDAISIRKLTDNYCILCLVDYGKTKIECVCEINTNRRSLRFIFLKSIDRNNILVVDENSKEHLILNFRNDINLKANLNGNPYRRIRSADDNVIFQEFWGGEKRFVHSMSHKTSDPMFLKRYKIKENKIICTAKDGLKKIILVDSFITSDWHYD